MKSLLILQLFLYSYYCTKLERKCLIIYSNRIECGYRLSKDECEARDCCFQEYHHGDHIPWCYMTLNVKGKIFILF